MLMWSRYSVVPESKFSFLIHFLPSSRWQWQPLRIVLDSVLTAAVACYAGALQHTYPVVLYYHQNHMQDEYFLTYRNTRNIEEPMLFPISLIPWCLHYRLAAKAYPARDRMVARITIVRKILSLSISIAGMKCQILIIMQRFGSNPNCRSSQQRATS